MSSEDQTGETNKGEELQNKKRLSLEDKKAKLEEKHKLEMASIKRQIKAKDLREAKKHKKLDDHYKIIEGALSRKHRLANPKSQHAKDMNRLFDEYVIKDDARVFFGLQPLPEKEKIKRTEEQKARRRTNKDMESF